MPSQGRLNFAYNELDGQKGLVNKVETHQKKLEYNIWGYLGSNNWDTSDKISTVQSGNGMFLNGNDEWVVRNLPVN